MTRKTIATPEEVLKALTLILRGEMAEEKGGPKVSERQRAAELLGKRYGLFDKPEAEEAQERVRQALPEVRQLVNRMKERCEIE